MVTQEIIDTGSIPNNRRGDSMRVAFSKINNNFANLSCLDKNIILSPIVIEDIQANKNSQEILKQAFETTNQNFANLASFCEDLITVDTSKDTLRVSFIKINNNFTNIFSQNTIIPVESNKNNTNFFSSSYEIFQPTLFGSSEQVVDIGAAPNDGTGDPLRTAFGKINNNFANLFSTVTTPVTSNTSGNAPNQVIFSTEILNFNQAQFTIRSTDGLANSQNIILSAQINNSNNNVKFTAYGTTFFGSPVCNYDMDVSGSNVRILCNPFNLGNLTHTIFSQALQLS